MLATAAMLGLVLAVCVAIKTAEAKDSSEKLIGIYLGQIQALENENDSLKASIQQQESKIKKLEENNNTLENAINELKELSAKEENNKQYMGKFTLTYYCISGVTKSGNPTQENYTVAVDPNVIPLGSTLHIDGLGTRVAHDTGGAIKGKKIDVYVKDYETAIKNGVTRDVDVWIIK